MEELMKEEKEELDPVKVYNMFTREEQEFLKNLLTQINIRPAQPDAEQVVMMVKSILSKLES